MRRVVASKRVALFVEGHTEHQSLASFFHRWIDPHLPVGSKVGFPVVNFKGIGKYLDDLANQLDLHLTQKRVNSVVGIVDLYGLPEQIDLNGCSTIRDKVISARRQIKELVPSKFQSQFRQHFAVHEFEAWLLACPDKWPQSIRDQIKKRPPEQVNFDKPPAKFLKSLLDRRYKKTVTARNILQSVKPQFAIDKCPYLKLLAEDLLQISQSLV